MEEVGGGEREGQKGRGIESEERTCEYAVHFTPAHM